MSDINYLYKRNAVIDLDKLRSDIDHCLKDYGVDWKIAENEPEYYQALLDEIMIVLNRNIK